MVFVLTMAVLSVHMVNGGRQRRNPQFVPVYSLHDDLHNHITGLSYDLHNRIAAATHLAAANAVSNSAFAFASNGGLGIRYPNNGNTFVQAFGPPGQQGIFISTFSGGSVRPSAAPGRPFTTSLRPASTPSRPASSPSRPASSASRPASNPSRPASVSSSLPVPASLRPSSTPSRPLSGNSILTNSGRPFAAAAAGPRPGGGVSASAVAVSTSGWRLLHHF